MRILILLLAAASTRAASPAARTPVLVELFTSEGCSSCPPADALLRELVQETSKDWRRVFCLGFHVDYWNRLGWTDPYSSAKFSQRQQAYARAMKADRVYTPQMIVGGTRQMVGSSSIAVRTAIGDAAREERANAPLLLTTENGSAVVVTNAPHADPVRSAGTVMLKAPFTCSLSREVGGVQSVRFGSFWLMHTPTRTLHTESPHGPLSPLSPSVIRTSLFFCTRLLGLSIPSTDSSA